MKRMNKFLLWIKQSYCMHDYKITKAEYTGTGMLSGVLQQNSYYVKMTCAKCGHVVTDILSPEYSENIADAFQVVEKFCSASISKLSNGKELTAYLVTEINGKNADGIAITGSFVHSVCLAALLAVMEVDE